MTIGDYLHGVHVMATDEMIATVLAERGVDSETDFKDVTEKTRDLSKADVLMSICLMPATTGGSEEQVGNWKQKKSGNTMTNANYIALRRLARALYRKWMEPWLYPASGGVRVNRRGMCI